MPAITVRKQVPRPTVIRRNRELIQLKRSYENCCRDLRNGSQCFAGDVLHAVTFTIVSHFLNSMQITYNDVITLLTILALIMVIILLYHLIFVSVSLKKIVNRWDDLSREVEALVLKPIGAIEYVLDWFAAAVDGMRETRERKREHKK